MNAPFAGAPSAPIGVGIVVSTRLKPGREGEYREWQKRISAECGLHPGFLGNEVFAPKPGLQEEWVVVVRFDTPEHLEGWLASEHRGRLTEEAARLWDEFRVDRIGGGFPGWFAREGAERGTVAVPRWKQAMLVLLALYPTVMLLGRNLAPRLSRLPAPLAIFLGDAVSVAILTWLLMPIANRAFGLWLSPGRSAGERFELLGAGVIVFGYVLSLLVFLSF